MLIWTKVLYQNYGTKSINSLTKFAFWCFYWFFNLHIKQIIPIAVLISPIGMLAKTHFFHCVFSFFSRKSWFSIFSSVHCNFHRFFFKIPSFFLLNAIIKLHEDFGKTGRHNGFASYFNISWPMYVVYILFPSLEFV